MKKFIKKLIIAVFGIIAFYFILILFVTFNVPDNWIGVIGWSVGAIIAIGMLYKLSFWVLQKNKFLHNSKTKNNLIALSICLIIYLIIWLIFK